MEPTTACESKITEGTALGCRRPGIVTLWGTQSNSKGASILGETRDAGGQWPQSTSINPGNSPCHALRISSCKSHTSSLSIWRLATSTWALSCLVAPALVRDLLFSCHRPRLKWYRPPAAASLGPRAYRPALMWCVWRVACSTGATNTSNKVNLASLVFASTPGEQDTIRGRTRPGQHMAWFGVPVPQPAR